MVGPRTAPVRRWGWHQLTDPWAERIVAEAGIRPGELVLDIGAGTGALTAPLLDAGARVIAVEMHPGRLQVLHDRFTHPRLRVVKADAAALRLPRRPFRVVANPPFTITMALLRRLLAPGSRLIAADLVLPRHAVRRWATGQVPGSRRWQMDYEVGMGRRVPGSAFRPSIGRDCATLVIRRIGKM